MPANLLASTPIAPATNSITDPNTKICCCFIGSLFTESTQPSLFTERIEPADPMLAIEPAEATLAMEPADPADRRDPLDPIDSALRLEPIEQADANEFVDRWERNERSDSRDKSCTVEKSSPWRVSGNHHATIARDPQPSPGARMFRSGTTALT